MTRSADFADHPLSHTDEGTARKGTVILLHSLGTSRDMWTPVIPALLESGYRVLCPDARGHGESSGLPAPRSPMDWVSDIRSLYRHAGVEHAHLVGVSMGAAQVLDYALKHPHTVESIVIGGAFGTVDADTATAKITALVGGAEEHGMAAWAERYVETTLFTDDLASRESIAKAIADMEFGAYAASARACFQPRVGDLSSLEIPVRIVWGSLDRKTPRVFSDDLVRALPDAEIIEIDGAGHLPNVDAPEAFVHRVLSHIQSARGTEDR